jgi:hypothetical protein
MSPTSLIAVWIVLAGVVLLLACAVSVTAENPPTAAGEAASAVSARVWCPAAGALTRVGLDRTTGSPRLTVLSCERFGDGPVECDRACIATSQAA